MEEDRIVINEDRIERLFKVSKRPINIAKTLIAIALIIILIVFFFNSKKNTVKEPIDYQSMVENQTKTKEEYIKIRITDIVRIDWQYCLLKDVKNNALVAVLNEETVNKILEEYKNKGEDFFYDIEGYIRYNLSEWEKSKIKIYLEKNNLLSAEDDYEKVFARGYINEQVSSNHILVICFVMLAVLFIITGLYFALIYWEKHILVKKYTKAFNCDGIICELKKNTTKIIEKQDLYLTEEYIVSLQNYLDIIKYKDIFWIYTIKGMLESILVVATAKGQFVIATAYEEDGLNKILEIIKEKNEKMLLGYTKENKKKYKEYKKRLK